MKLDESTWRQVLAVLPAADGTADVAMAVAFLDADEYAAKNGSAWLWWPDGSRPDGRCDFDGRFPPDWGMLLVMDESALERVCVEGEPCMAGLVRRLQIKPFLLQERDALEAGGILDFIENLELATPKH